MPSRYAVVDLAGNVTNIIIADLSDQLPSATLIETLNYDVCEGYFWTGTEFILGPELQAAKETALADELAAIRAESEVFD